MENYILQYYTNAITLEKYLSLAERNKIFLLSFFFMLFFFIFIINFSIILILELNIFQFLLCLEIFYLNIILFTGALNYALNFPICNAFILYVLIFAALETVLGLGIVLLNKNIFGTINFKYYLNNRF